LYGVRRAAARISPSWAWFVEPEAVGCAVAGRPLPVDWDEAVAAELGLAVVVDEAPPQETATIRLTTSPANALFPATARTVPPSHNAAGVSVL